MHTGGIFDLLVNINDINSLNAAIDTPAGQPQGQVNFPSPFSGSFFQLPGTVAPSPAPSGQPSIAVAQPQVGGPIALPPPAPHLFRRHAGGSGQRHPHQRGH